jgi:hypothetical protein
MGFELGCSTPSWVISAENIAGDIVPIAGSVLDVIDPPLDPLVTLVVNGFNSVKQALVDYQTAMNNGTATPTMLQAIQAVFATLQKDAQNLLTAFGSSSSATDGIIVGIINLIAQAVSDLANLLPKSMSKKLSMVRFPLANTWSGAEFTKRYNELIAGDPRFHKL